MYLKSMARCFDRYIHNEMITTIKLIKNLSAHNSLFVVVPFILLSFCM